MRSLKSIKLNYKTLDNNMNKIIDILEAITYKVPMMSIDEQSLWWSHTADMWEFNNVLKDSLIKLEEALKDENDV